MNVLALLSAALTGIILMKGDILREEELHEKVSAKKPTVNDLSRRLSKEVCYLINRIEELEKRVRELEIGPQPDPEMVRDSALQMIREIEGRTTEGLDELKKTQARSSGSL